MCCSPAGMTSAARSRGRPTARRSWWPMRVTRPRTSIGSSISGRCPLDGSQPDATHRRHARVVAACVVAVGDRVAAYRDEPSTRSATQSCCCSTRCQARRSTSLRGSIAAARTPRRPGCSSTAAASGTRSKTRARRRCTPAPSEPDPDGRPGHHRCRRPRAGRSRTPSRRPPGRSVCVVRDVDVRCRA